jgi:hypothetical protein
MIWAMFDGSEQYYVRRTADENMETQDLFSNFAQRSPSGENKMINSLQTISLIPHPQAANSCSGNPRLSCYAHHFAPVVCSVVEKTRK